MNLLVKINSGNIVFPNGDRLCINLKPSQITIESGTIVVIKGMNGTGKSSFLKSISNVYSHYFDKKPKYDVMAEWFEDGKSIDMIPSVVKNFGLNKTLRGGYLTQSIRSNIFCQTVENEIAFSLEHSGLSCTEINSCLKSALLDLNSLNIESQKASYKLSKGQQQILGFKSLVQLNPEILFLDEPSTALDDNALEWLFYNLLNLIASSRVKIIFIISQDSRLLQRLEKHESVCSVIVDGVIKNSNKKKLGKINEFGHFPKKTLSFSDLKSSWDNFKIELPDLQLNPGEALLILGKNGSGKSTILETITGFKKTTSGKIYFGETCKSAKRMHWDNTINYAFQNAEDQIIFINSEKELKFPQKNIGWNAACRDLVIESGINWYNSPWHLSFGQRKLLTYFSLAFGSSILIVDEPLTSFDEIYKKYIIQIFNTFINNGGILILTSSQKHIELENIINMQKVIL